VGFGAGFEGDLKAVASLGGVFVLEFREAVDLDLDRAFAVFRRSRHADDVADFDSGVGADAGLLEGGAGNDAVLVGDVENRRPAGLFDLRHDALEVDLFAHGCLETVGSGQGVVVRDRLERVVVDVDRLEGEVTVLADAFECDDEFVADAVGALENRFVDESGD